MKKSYKIQINKNIPWKNEKGTNLMRIQLFQFQKK